MHIASLSLTNLGPFDEVAFEFDRHVNVFVGPNNCGKSTALFALGDIAVDPFLVPEKLLRKDAAEFRAWFGPRRRQEDTIVGSFPIAASSKRWSDSSILLYERKRKQLGYTVFIPALRWSTDFRSEGPIQPRKQRKHDRVQLWPGIVADAQGLQREHDYPVALVRDKEIVQEIIELDYRAYRHDKPAIRELIERIAAIASEVTEGFPIQFAGIAEDERGLYPQFDTPDGKMPLDVLSQGTQSLIQWLARLIIGYAKAYDFPDRLDTKSGILILDEIDAHMHPSWARRILPVLASHFPRLQVFCSTHSPLMLAGLKAGQVHLMTRRDEGGITVSRNETDIVGWSSDEILTCFLGVDAATDLESADKLRRLAELRQKKRLSVAERREITALRQEVREKLLAGPSSEGADDLVRRLRQELEEPSTKRALRRKSNASKAPNPSVARKPARATKVKS